MGGGSDYDADWDRGGCEGDRESSSGGSSGDVCADDGNTYTVSSRADVDNRTTHSDDTGRGRSSSKRRPSSQRRIETHVVYQGGRRSVQYVVRPSGRKPTVVNVVVMALVSFLFFGVLIYSIYYIYGIGVLVVEAIKESIEIIIER